VDGYSKICFCCNDICCTDSQTLMDCMECKGNGDPWKVYLCCRHIHNPPIKCPNCHRSGCPEHLDTVLCYTCEGNAGCNTCIVPKNRCQIQCRRCKSEMLELLHKKSGLAKDLVQLLYKTLFGQPVPTAKVESLSSKRMTLSIEDFLFRPFSPGT
jgi:hypothetical protein